MTLDEAIEHAREVSSQECAECKKEHEQLANWLEELKQLQSIIGDEYDVGNLQELIKVCNGKTPNQINRIFEEWSHYLNFISEKNAIENAVDEIYDDGNIDYKRLQKLIKADKDGRCAIFPCKINDTVYSIRSKFYNYKEHTEIQQGKVKGFEFEKVWVVWVNFDKDNPKSCISFKVNDFGKTIFYNREDAEKCSEKKRVINYGK